MKPITQYVQEVWQAKEGLPQNTVMAIVQTRDGYVWLGTQNGLARFDGVRFTVYNKENTAQIKHNYIRAIYESNDGSLWIGTNAGLCRLRDGEWTLFGTAEGLSNESVTAICEGTDGRFWIGTWGGGLICLQNGFFETFAAAEGLSNNFILAICEDRRGNVWVGTDGGGLFCFRDGKFTAYPTGEKSSGDCVRSILEDRAGNLWVSTKTGLKCFRSDGSLTTYTVEDGLSSNIIWSLFEDSAGVLWVGTVGGGLNRFEDGRFTAFAAEGLLGDFIHSIKEDSEGGLWVGTGSGGINRFSEGCFTVLTTAEGLSNDNVWATLEDPEGALWIGTSNGVNRLAGGEWTSYTTVNDLPLGLIRAICCDSEGGIWIGGNGGSLFRYKDGEWHHSISENNLTNTYVSALFCDSRGALWISWHGGGLTRLKDGVFERYTVENGLSNNYVSGIIEDARGSVWVTTRGDGLNQFKNGEWTHYATEDGLSDNHFYSIYLDAEEDAMWICAQSGGLLRFKDGKFTLYSTQDGLHDDTLYKALEDSQGNLWFSSIKGMFRVNKRELNEFADGVRAKITSKALGTEDGMKSAECNGGTQAAGARLADGRLCFPTILGAAILDPKDVKINRVPRVIIETVIVDKREVAQSKEKINLPPGEGDLEFQYTGLNFKSPQKVQFKYKLEGYDREWTDAGTRRVAFYTNIPPGDYRFRVVACNGDGVWNETGASVSFKLEPHFYQTKSFFSLCALAAGGAAFGAYKHRIRKIKSREEELIALVEERTSELAEANRALQQLSVVDSLTGVANRRRFDEVLETEWRRAQRSSGVLSLIMIDVDYFKLFNDFYGHQAGDECLRSVVQAMKNVVRRAGELLARYGGEEFAVILQSNTADSAIKVGEILRARVEALQIPHAKSAVSGVVTVSLGAATAFPTSDSSPTTLIEEADKALYRAKEKGRNRVEILRDAIE